MLFINYDFVKFYNVSFIIRAIFFVIKTFDFNIVIKIKAYYTFSFLL